MSPSNHHKESSEFDIGLGSSVKMPKKFKITSEWVWRGLAGLLLILNLYLKGTFVSADAYQKDQKDINEQIKNLNLLVSNMEVRNEVNTRQDSELADHELRLRSLEVRTGVLRPTGHSNPNP